jgi:ubiquinone/menaquinone biosynthesis C-methylase UbiE
MPKKTINELAVASGSIFKAHPYFKIAEPNTGLQWKNRIDHWIKDADYSEVIDLAAGHGRHSAILAERCKTLHVTDINPECISAARERLGAPPHIHYHVIDGSSLSFASSGSISLVFTFDSMVHFDDEVVFSYIDETSRVLRAGGLGFFHHSNYTASPGGDFRKNPHGRNFMSQAFFIHRAQKAGLEVVRSEAINWGGGDNFVKNLDCLTLVRKQ